MTRKPGPPLSPPISGSLAAPSGTELRDEKQSDKSGPAMRMGGAATRRWTLPMCVDRHRLNNTFTGVSTKALIDRAKPKPSARFVMCHSEAGFTTNVPLAEFIGDDCILAYAWDGKDLTPDHGYPLRGLVPRLYLWKSAKWIRAIELRATDAPGFWEQNGYHMHGDPWSEERFGW